MRGDQLPCHFAGRIPRQRDAEEDLHRSAVVLIEPAFQAVPGLGVHAFERLQQSNRRRVTTIGNALMQREAHRNDKLPQHDTEAEECERCQDHVQHQARFLNGQSAGCKCHFFRRQQNNHRRCRAQNWSTATTRRISSSGVCPVRARRRPVCHSVCMPCWMATSCSERVGSFCMMASRRISFTTSISVMARSEERPVKLHSLQPTPLRNEAFSRSSRGTVRSIDGSGWYGSAQNAQFFRTRRRPTTPLMLEARRNGSISMLINRAKTPAVLPL